MKLNNIDIFDKEFARVIFDRETRQKAGCYLFERTDKLNGFDLIIKKNNQDIIKINYGPNGGVVSNIDATADEINVVVKTLNSSFSQKSYVRWLNMFNSMFSLNNELNGKNMRILSLQMMIPEIPDHIKRRREEEEAARYFRQKDKDKKKWTESHCIYAMAYLF